MTLVKERLSVNLKKVMVATDFTQASANVVPYAKAPCRGYLPVVEIVNVWDPMAITPYEDTLLGLSEQKRRHIATERLLKLQSEFEDEGLRAQIALPESPNVPAALLKRAKDWHADLLIAGTESKRGLDRLVLGSTAEALIRSAGCPVLTVGPKVQPAPEGPLALKSIVFATDFSAEAAKAASLALSFAEDHGARLVYCFVLGGESKSTELNELLDRGFTGALQQLVPEESYNWCRPECTVEHGKAAVEILALAERVHADLLVLGAHSASFWLTHIRHGLTPDLLASARCPVLTTC